MTKTSYLRSCPKCKGLAYGMSKSDGAWIQCSICDFRIELEPSYTKACHRWNELPREEPQCSSENDGLQTSSTTHTCAPQSSNGSETKPTLWPSPSEDKDQPLP